MKISVYSLLLLALLSFAEVATGQDAATAETTATTETTADATADTPAEAEPEATTAATDETTTAQEEEQAPVQAGPFIDLLGEQLYSMEIIDQTSARINAHYTNELLAGKKVIGLYFSADWCGPCRQFTPELVKFYERMNNRRGKKDQFEIVWVSRCRDVDSYAQYFAQMPWVALPPEEAMGQRGQLLAEKYKTKGIPHLVLLDDLGQTITIDARNKIPQDKAGIGFPWRSPLSQLISTIVPRSFRLMVRSQMDAVKGKLLGKIKSMVGMKMPAQAQTA